MRIDQATNTTLLEGLKDPRNQTAWADYVGRYRPLILAYCQRCSLPPTDAEDVAQDALIAFADSYRKGGYDKARGPLRGWLFGIVRHTLLDWQRSRQRRPEVQAPVSGSQTGFLSALADEDRMTEWWEAEWRNAVVRQCLAAVRRQLEPDTVAAFELFALQGLPARDVAARLGITTNAVFIAKHRVLRRMRELQPLLEENW
jgi:RNA polymerase sigma-70 factor (ECF subfamily)